METLTNTPDLQAVRHTGLKVLLAVFRKPGRLDAGSGWVVRVDQPCLALLRESLSIRVEIGDIGGMAWCVEKLAGIAHQRGDSGGGNRFTSQPGTSQPADDQWATASAPAGGFGGAQEEPPF